MLKENFTLRVMNRKEVDFAIEWAAAEGWNPGLHDADSFYTADSEGFLVGCVGDEPVACISAVRYGKTFAFVGFFLVKPEYRGNLYGYYLGFVRLGAGLLVLWIMANLKVMESFVPVVRGSK